MKLFAEPKALLGWVGAHRINEYSDLLVLLVTLVGVPLTLWKVRRSREASVAASEAAATAAKKAADDTAKAVAEVRSDLQKIETVADFSSAIAAMEEIKRLHRRAELDSLLERYSALRRSLISLKSSDLLQDEADQSLIQKPIAQFASFERQMERKLAEKDAKVDFARANRVVSSLVDELLALLIQIRASIGRQK